MARATRQDQQRRELIANISHDLRTPLTSLHGYLETLSLKADTLSETERKRYLGIALAQSVKVGRLAQALFELARLEHGNVQPALEDFSLVDLVQDVFQKFELPAEARHIQLRADIPPRLADGHADLGMIERVLTNLLDNAIRHTPAGGTIDVDLAYRDGKVRSGQRHRSWHSGGVARRAIRTAVQFGRCASRRRVGLLIVQRMLQLHHSRIRLVEREGTGTAFCFELPTTEKPAVAGIPL